MFVRYTRPWFEWSNALFVELVEGMFPNWLQPSAPPDLDAVGPLW